MFGGTSNDFAVAAREGACCDEYVDERDGVPIGSHGAIHPGSKACGSAVEWQKGEKLPQTLDAPGFVGAVWPTHDAPMEFKPNVGRKVCGTTIPREALQVAFRPRPSPKGFNNYLGVDRRRWVRPRGPSEKPRWRSL